MEEPRSSRRPTTRSSRLVLEHACRDNNGLYDTLHEVYVEHGEPSAGHRSSVGRPSSSGRQMVANPPRKDIRHICATMRFVAVGPDEADGTTILVTFMDADGTRSSVPWSVGEDHCRPFRADAAGLAVCVACRTSICSRAATRSTSRRPR